jgi:D-alanyl-D-alanine carboxypeptidase
MRAITLIIPLVGTLLATGCTTDSHTAIALRAAGPCVTDPAKVVAAAPPATGPLPADQAARLDAGARAAFRTAAAPGAIVGVQTPRGRWTAAYGYADPIAKTPMTTAEHVRVGSVTKTFTGTLLLQLAQEGRLSLDDPIGKYQPGVPNGDQITLRQLADMTSGVASYYTPAFLTRYFGDPSGTFTPDELIAYGVSASPVFAPGAMFDYSNTNTILLGKVIEKVTGQPVEDVLRDRIFTPLGLTGTSMPTTSPDIPAPHPRGYTLQGGGNPDHPTDATDWNPSFGWTAGAIISDLPDQLAYDRALATGQGVLPPAAQVARLTSFPEPAGYGLALGCADGWVGHTGELPGFNTTVYYDTRTDTSVVVMVNSDIPSGNCPAEAATLTDNPTDVPCASPAVRVFVGVSAALGHAFRPPTK